MKIGTFELGSPVILGPMAGVTDLPFRRICKEYGAGLLVTEMVSARALYYGDKKTARIMRIEEEERPVALQLFGNDPEVFVAIMDQINGHNHDILDINMGCPAPKIVKNGEGSALMKDPKKAEALIKAVVKHSTKPVTVKFRKGWDDDNINAVDFAAMAEAAGADAVAVHGRTREQFYSGKADWDIIRRVKEKVNIPVIGNGDIFSVDDAIAMKEQTNCDGLMIARGVQGNPWLLREVSTYMATGERIAPPSVEERIRVASKHFQYLLEVKGERIGILEMRKHAAWYLKGVPRSAAIRNEINRSTSAEEVVKLLESALELQ